MPSPENGKRPRRGFRGTASAWPLCTLLALGWGCMRADVALPAVLGDHMVIQRDQPVHLWGKASPNEPVSAVLSGHTASTTADSFGFWSLYLPPVPAGGPFEITLKGKNSLILRDVLAGDVWIASGQSNMEFPMRRVMNSASEIASANQPLIRLFHVEHKIAASPLDDVQAKGWVPCSPQSVIDFSAVAYFFGRHLAENLKVPIGLIETSWGGTPAEAWTSMRAISSDSALMPVFAAWARLTDERTAEWKLRRTEELREYRDSLARAKAEGKPAPEFPYVPNEEGEWAPGTLFNGMIQPLIGYRIRGAIWYQGESNASQERVAVYARLFETMILDWREAWKQGNFPFLFVQLAGYRAPRGATWPELREAQRQALALRHTGMAVAIDVGNPDDIHPTDKQDIGLRLALAARAIAYGEKLEYSGPLFRETTSEDHAIRVWFDHTGSGLMAKGGQLKTFEIAGPDRNFVPAQARIEGDTVVVSSSSVPNPAYVRYAWSDYCDCNLYNREGLPASPFESQQILLDPAQQ